MKTTFFLMIVCLTGLLICTAGPSLEAREHRHRNKVQLRVGAGCDQGRCDSYVVRRYAVPQRVYVPGQVYVPETAYVPARPVIYQPVYVYQEPRAYVEEVHVRPVRRCLPSLFTGLSFTWNFR